MAKSFMKIWLGIPEFPECDDTLSVLLFRSCCSCGCDSAVSDLPGHTLDHTDYPGASCGQGDPEWHLLESTLFKTKCHSVNFLPALL